MALSYGLLGNMRWVWTWNLISHGSTVVRSARDLSDAPELRGALVYDLTNQTLEGDRESRSVSELYGIVVWARWEHAMGLDVESDLAWVHSSAYNTRSLGCA
jgi:hypothetical protein